MTKCFRAVRHAALLGLFAALAFQPVSLTAQITPRTPRAAGAWAGKTAQLHIAEQGGK